MVDPCCSRILSAEKNHFAALFGELIKGLLTETVRDALPSVIRSRGDFAYARELRVGARCHDAGRAGEVAIVAFKQNDVAVVVGFIA